MKSFSFLFLGIPHPCTTGNRFLKHNRCLPQCIFVGSALRSFDFLKWVHGNPANTDTNQSPPCQVYQKTRQRGSIQQYHLLSMYVVLCHLCAVSRSFSSKVPSAVSMTPSHSDRTGVLGHHHSHRRVYLPRDSLHSLSSRIWFEKVLSLENVRDIN
jgi:hypothetical protein